MAVCLCAIWPFTALAAESDPVKIERVKLKFESFRPKDGYVKITNLGTGYSVGDCEIINDVISTTGILPTVPASRSN